MPGAPTVARRSPALPLVVLALLLLGTVACGGGGGHEEAEPSATQACREQWGDVAETIIDMDAETHPSGLAERWSTVIANVDFQQHHASGTGCQEAIEKQLRAIDTLRQYGARLQVYDMELQLRTVRPQVEVYLDSATIRPYRDEDGRKVVPPPKPKVRTALATLAANAEAANEQLAPAWAQANAISLAKQEEVRRSVRDLDRLATSSPAFRTSEAALQVLVAAVRALENQ